MLDITKAEWIWTDTESHVNEYIEFREEIFLDSFCEYADLIISCDGNYTAYINGAMVATGQFSDYPERPTYSRIGVAKHLRKGKNVVLVIGYHFGINHASHIDTEPSLLYAVSDGEKLLTKVENVKYRLSRCYHSGKLERISSQLGFVFEYNAGMEDGSAGIDYSCGNDWKNITGKNKINRPVPTVRPLPLPELKTPIPMNIVAQGLFLRSADCESKTFAQMVQSDFLSTRRAADLFDEIGTDNELIGKTIFINGDVLEQYGVYFIVDLGSEQCGHISLDMDGPKGTVIDIAVGEHLADMRVRASIGGHNYASRYICGDGRKVFTHYNNRYAGRYVQVHVSSTIGPVTINYAGIIPSEYPVSFAENFESHNYLLNRIYDVSRRTLQLCMHEHYEDCPWREQALYANDARNQALTGYYAFGEYDFPRVSLDLLGRSIRRDNYLSVTAPSKCICAIPSFTMVWFLAMDDLLLFSGNVHFIMNYFPQMQRMLDSYIERCIDGLLPCPQGNEYWHFYDWADGLSGYNNHGREILEYQRFDAPLNLLFVLALESASRIAKSIGYEDVGLEYAFHAATVKQSINAKFWVESRNAYKTYFGENSDGNHFCELVQSLAILSTTADGHRADMLRQQITLHNNGLIETSLSQSIYKFEALCRDVDSYGYWVFNTIRNIWSQMLYCGATSFWETIKGQVDFGNLGSLCHGWSAIPIYFCHAGLLGVKPLENGFKQFSVAPFTKFVDRCQGTVMTSAGPISAEWKNMGAKTLIKVICPEALKPVVDIENPNFEWILRNN